MKVFITTEHPGDAIERLSRKSTIVPGKYEQLSRDELIGGAQVCDALICVLRDRIDAALMDACPSLKVIANVAVGFDNIDVTAATERNILVTNTPGVLDETTADLAFALMLATARRIVEADNYVRAGLWDGWKTDLMMGVDVHHKTLGVVGFGRIGQAVARRAAAFRMKALYTRSREGESEFAQSIGARKVELEELLAGSDFVTLHCPLNAETRHLLSTQQFARMKRSSILINTARGAVVDEAALVSALETGVIAGAGLDVFEDEPRVNPALLSMRNVVLAPHIGSATIETRSAMIGIAVDGVLEAFAGHAIGNAVNPEVWPAFLKRIEKTTVE